MKEVALGSFHQESFVDETVTTDSLDIDEKNFEVQTDGAELTSGTYLKKAVLNICNWGKLKVLQREGDNIKVLKELPSEFLTSIIEFHYSEDELKLVGLGYNCWIEWIFTKPEVTIYGEVEEEN